MTVTADPDSITQVLYNLLDNAVKFADEGSTITVALWKQNGKAYVSVKDHGDTIPADDLPLVFDRFHKSDRSRSKDRDGVGLGLYLVKSILDAHNEDIAVTSSDGTTEFVFTLTLAREKPKVASARKRAANGKQAPEKARPGTRAHSSSRKYITNSTFTKCLVLFIAKQICTVILNCFRG